MFYYALEGKLRPLTKYPIHHHVSQGLSTSQLVWGFFLYGTLIALGTLFFSIILQKLDDIYFYKMYSDLFLKIQSHVNSNLLVFQENPSKTSVLKFFTKDISPISPEDYIYIWRLFDIKLNLPLPEIEPAPTLSINYFFVYIYIFLLFISLFYLFWFFCIRSFVPTTIKSTYILSHKHRSGHKRPLHTVFYRGMHKNCGAGKGGSDNIDNFLAVYNSVVKDLQSDSNLFNLVAWITRTVGLDINDITNIFYIKRIISLVGKVAPYDIVVGMRNLINSRGGLDFSTAFSELKGVQSRIGLLTDTLKIKPELLHTPVSEVHTAVLTNTAGTSTTVYPNVNYSVLVSEAPVSEVHTVVPINIAETPTIVHPNLNCSFIVQPVQVQSTVSNSLLIDTATTTVPSNSLFYHIFKIVIISAVCVGAFFICKNLFCHHSENNLDIVFVKLSNVKSYNNLCSDPSRGGMLKFFSCSTDQQYSLMRIVPDKGLKFLDVLSFITHYSIFFFILLFFIASFFVCWWLRSNQSSTK